LLFLSSCFLADVPLANLALALCFFFGVCFVLPGFGFIPSGIAARPFLLSSFIFHISFCLYFFFVF